MLTLNFFALVAFLFCGTVQAEDFSAHSKQVKQHKERIRLLEDELEKKMEIKNRIRGEDRVEEILQRIFEIHAELLEERQKLEKEIVHIKSEHKEEGKEAKLIVEEDEGESGLPKHAEAIDPVEAQMDDLFRKIQIKYASFVLEKRGTEDLEEVAEAEKRHLKQKKEKEAANYLRRKSKIKLEK